MTTVVARRLKCADNGDPLPTDGELWANQANKEVEELWNLANCTLTAVTGTNAITAQCQIAGLLNPIAGYQDGQEFTFIPAANSTAAVTINIDSKGAEAVVDQDGNALTSSVGLIGGRATKIRRVGGSWRVQGLVASSAAAYPFPKGWITPSLYGLTVSTDAGDLNNYIAVTAGTARDSTDAQNINLASALTKRMNFAWVAGTNAGCMLQSANLTGTISVTSGSAAVTGVGTTFTTDFVVGQIITTLGGQSRRITVISSNTAMTVASNFSVTESAVTYKRGGKAPSTSYRVFLLRKDADGTGDIATCAVDTPNDLPSGYTTYRLIGWVITDSSGNNIPFVHYADDVWILEGAVTEATLVHNSFNSIANDIDTVSSFAPPQSEVLLGMAVSQGSGGTNGATISEKLRSADYSSLVYRSISWTYGTTTPGTVDPVWVQLNASAQYVVAVNTAGFSTGSGGYSTTVTMTLFAFRWKR